MSLLQRIAKAAAPFPFTTTHRITPALPSIRIQEVPTSALQQAGTYRITNGILSSDSTPVSPDLLFSIAGTAAVSAFSPLGSQTFLAEISQLDSTWISSNLFEPLGGRGTAGAEYANRGKKAATAPPKIQSTDQSGFTKAYSRTRTLSGTSSHTIHALSIWDLIYPTLLPPPAVEFEPDIDVLHKLRPYQQVGVKFLVEHQSALLADDMGTGKTVMTSVALRVLFQSGKIRRALIVCPVSVLKVWQDHLSAWAPELTFTVVRGSREERKLDWRFPAHIFVAAYDTVASDFLTVVKKKTTVTCKACGRTATFAEKVHITDEPLPTFRCPHCQTNIEQLPTSESLVDPQLLGTFDLVVLDEAQYIKNPSTSRSHAVRSTKPKYRWALTGTPVETKVEDLGGIFSFVKPKHMPYNVSASHARNLMEPYFLRRLKRDVMPDLPPKTKDERWVELDHDQRAEYDRIKQGEIRKLTDLGEQVTKAHIFAVLTALKRTCNLARGKDRSPKIEAMLELLETVKESGQKAIVFTQWVDEYGVGTLEKVLRQLGVSVLKGGLSDSSRDSVIQRFRSDPQVCVLLATLKTGGVGLTLTEANYVFHFDHWWNPASMWQAEDRVHRHGQQRGVNVYSFWTKNTIEQRIYDLLKERGLLFETVVNSLSDTDIERSITTEDWLDMLGVPTRKSRT